MTFQEPSFKVIQFLILKSIDRLQAIRPNDSYLLLGHAAQVSLAIGIDKSQVANGNSLNTHRLRIAFWIIYTNERMSALYTGRPSSLTDDHIDVPYPEDLPQLHHYGSILDANTHSPAKECAWIRSMSQIGRLTERVAKYVYSSGSARSIEDLFKVKLETMECDLILDGVVASLPPYLDFLDDTSPVGEEWQEIQRAHLALNYNMVRMIMHRPALVFAGFFASKEEAGEDASDIMTVRCSMVICVGAAKDIITTASDVMFNRFPDIRNDASVAAFLIAACVTLLYDVLAPDTNTDYGKIILGYVNRGIHCLDQMEHVGPTTGKALSIDIMKCAQDALKFSNEKTCRFGDMIHEFPWLRDAPEPPVVNSGQVPDTSFNQTYPFQYDPDLDYTFDWLDGSVLDLDVLKNL
ncbi:hypothetical protein N7465_009083 [Penicillium sp. CMV-2018d]|nr:hypothetical protein N7465_009083 [Penicillium sp. CMV-2018d]